MCVESNHGIDIGCDSHLQYSTENWRRQEIAARGHGFKVRVISVLHKTEPVQHGRFCRIHLDRHFLAACLVLQYFATRKGLGQHAMLAAGHHNG